MAHKDENLEGKTVENTIINVMGRKVLRTMRGMRDHVVVLGKVSQK